MQKHHLRCVALAAVIIIWALLPADKDSYYREFGQSIRNRYYNNSLTADENSGDIRDC